MEAGDKNVCHQEESYASIGLAGPLLTSPSAMPGMTLLQPASINSSLPTSKLSSSDQVGSTWVNSGSLNINIDNLSLGGFRGTNKQGSNAPSMNQLAVSSPTSPMHPAQPIRPQVFSPVHSGMVSPSIPAIPGVMGTQHPVVNQPYFPAFK